MTLKWEQMSAVISRFTRPSWRGIAMNHSEILNAAKSAGVTEPAHAIAFCLGYQAGKGLHTEVAAKSPKSIASVRINPSTPCLLAAYAAP